MNTRIYGIGLLFLGAVVLQSACTVSAAPGAVTVSCVDEGGDCADDAECCSYACGSDSVCSGPNNCVLDNDACGNDSDCCSMICASDGYCGIP